MAKAKTGKTVKTETILNGTAGMEATVGHLQRAIDALDDAAWYFECLGMDTQSEQLDEAADEIQDVQDLLGVFLGTVDQVEPFADVKPAKPLKKPRKAHKAIAKRAKVAA
ncbi:hypothetical protein HDF16_003821 [Granulicella aggregans]|uniref:Uncharacterized protein n=1 Tax=Granulicella aggregans TaxID=474949 RepID=A0A7W7ZG37_9BACT|nr:hypothetical protein [Granulicella aggregans]MBB5059098.1 hypothetical protein [Granulicella aggregans]